MTIIRSRGYWVCTRCGTTNGQVFVDHLPVKLLKSGELYSHNSPGKSLDFVSGLGSHFYPRSSEITPSQYQKFRRLARIHNPIRLDRSSTHIRSIYALQHVCNLLHISKSIQERALFIYWKHAHREEITNHILLIALCLIQAVKEAKSDAPIKFSEIIKVFQERGHRVTNRNVLKLAQELDIRLGRVFRRAEDYVERICNQLVSHHQLQSILANHQMNADEYGQHLKAISMKFLNLLDMKSRGSVQPYPFAISVVYLADRAMARYYSKKPILTQALVAEITGSAEYTIRDHIYRFLGSLFKEKQPILEQFISSYSAKSTGMQQ